MCFGLTIHQRLISKKNTTQKNSEVLKKRMKVMVANSEVKYKSKIMLEVFRYPVLHFFFILLLYDKVPITCTFSLEYKNINTRHALIKPIVHIFTEKLHSKLSSHTLTKRLRGEGGNPATCLSYRNIG